MILLFDKPLMDDAKWELKLSAPGFWNEFRSSGVDQAFVNVEGNRYDYIDVEFKSDDPGSFKVEIEQVQFCPADVTASLSR